MLVAMQVVLLLAALSSCLQVEAQHKEEPKLVCYYTNWAKDRPKPYSYVS